MKAPIRVTVTGAAGQIGYATLFRIANGDMLGREQPVILQLLDLPQAQPMLRGVMMELEDCAFPLLQQIIITDDPRVAFRDTEVVLLIGARPRGKGMERKDLLEANGAIFTTQGKLLNELAAVYAGAKLKDDRLYGIRANYGTGIIASLFTSIYISRFIYDWILERHPGTKTLSI